MRQKNSQTRRPSKILMKSKKAFSDWVRTQMMRLGFSQIIKAGEMPMKTNCCSSEYYEINANQGAFNLSVLLRV